jgi:hypothetical protein
MRGDALLHYEESASFRREPELVVAELIWMNRQKFIDKLNADIVHVGAQQGEMSS